MRERRRCIQSTSEQDTSKLLRTLTVAGAEVLAAAVLGALLPLGTVDAPPARAEEAAAGMETEKPTDRQSCDYSCQTSKCK